MKKFKLATLSMLLTLTISGSALAGTISTTRAGTISTTSAGTISTTAAGTISTTAAGTISTTATGTISTTDAIDSSNLPYAFDLADVFLSWFVW